MSQIIKKICILSALSFCVVGGCFAFTNPAEKYPGIDLYLEDASLVWQSPTWFKQKNLALAPQDITYRKNVLPYEEDRYADMYMVIPQLGLVTPIQQIPRDSGDRSSMINGREISINKYLQ